MTSQQSIVPPTPRRDEDRYVLAGKLKPTDVGYADPKNPKNPLLRQSESSTEALLDPPVKIPDPYGWMRDESRTNQEVLDHLKAENEYTEKLTEHLEGLRKDLYNEMLAGIKEVRLKVVWSVVILTEKKFNTCSMSQSISMYIYVDRLYCPQS